MGIIQPAWLSGLLGGLMIGCAAALLLLVNARILGASGILGGLVSGEGGAVFRERLVFVAGLVLAPGLLALAVGPPASHVGRDSPLLALAGLLVGFGTRMANGCTSGHGVCGMSRLSVRSIVATLIYVGFGVATVTLARHLPGLL